MELTRFRGHLNVRYGGVMAKRSVRYTPEFKQQMVGLVRSGRTAASLAGVRALGVDDRAVGGLSLDVAVTRAVDQTSIRSSELLSFCSIETIPVHLTGRWVGGVATVFGTITVMTPCW